MPTGLESLWENASVNHPDKFPSSPEISRSGEPGGREEKSKSACKPGSVLLRSSTVIIHLGRMSPYASSDLPGNWCGPHFTACAARSPIWSCSGWGLPCHRFSPARCALTAPFHPYPALPRGGIFSVALSVGSRPPGVTWHPVLRSPDFPLSPRTGF